MESLTGEDPRSIGGYELRALLGEGGFGRVYLGLSASGRAVAVKVLQGEYTRDREFLRRFQLEVSAAQRVNGIYTAPVIAAGLDDRPPWLATAFVPGPSLQSAVTTYGPLPEPALWRLLAGLVEALQAIHACGLVHRDLKPANVMLAADGPRVIDFGISKALDGTAMTSTGSIFGTPAFMAPEQAAGREVSAATDVFALGCVLVFAATGVPPFGWGNGHSVLYRVVHEAADLGRTPPQLRPVLEQCLTKDPALRPRLADLAGIGRDGPSGALGGQSAASFWPPQVGKLIRDYQDAFEASETARPATAGRPARQAGAGPSASAPESRVPEFSVPPAGAPAMPSYPPAGAPVPAPPPQPGGIGYGDTVTGSLRPGPPGLPSAQGTQPPYGTQPQSPPGMQPAYGVPTPRQRPPGRGAGPHFRGKAPAASAFMAVGAGLSALGVPAAALWLPIVRGWGLAALTEWRISPFNAYALPSILFYLVECGLWLLTAWAVRTGRGWGRTAGSVLFGLFVLVSVLYRADLGLLEQTIFHVDGFGGFRLRLAVGSLLTLLTGVAGFAAVLSLWLTPTERPAGLRR